MERNKRFLGLGKTQLTSEIKYQTMGLGQAQVKFKKVNSSTIIKRGNGLFYGRDIFGPGQCIEKKRNVRKGLYSGAASYRNDPRTQSGSVSEKDAQILLKNSFSPSQVQIKENPTPDINHKDGTLNFGERCGSGHSRYVPSGSLRPAKCFKEGTYLGEPSTRNAKTHFAKLKPKKPNLFIHGKISSSQFQEQVDFSNIRKVGSCSLGNSVSLTTQEDGHHKGFQLSSHKDRNTQFFGVSNLAVNSGFMEEFDFESDGDAQCINMIPSSSSAAIDDEEEEEAGSQSSDDNEVHTDNQFEVLEDIRSLFNENQELAANSVQVSNLNSNFFSIRDCSMPKPLSVIHPITHDFKNHPENRERGEGTNVVEEVVGGELVEVEVREEGGEMLTEQETRWEDIVEMAQNMGFCLVPFEKSEFQEGKSLSVRRKGEKKELRNLRFGVNFKESEFRRGTFNSK